MQQLLTVYSNVLAPEPDMADMPPIMPSSARNLALYSSRNDIVFTSESSPSRDAVNLHSTPYSAVLSSVADSFGASPPARAAGLRARERMSTNHDLNDSDTEDEGELRSKKRARLELAESELDNEELAPKARALRSKQKILTYVGVHSEKPEIRVGAYFEERAGHNNRRTG